MKKALNRYKGFKMTLVDTDDSFWVSFENKYFQDCTERFNDKESAVDSAKAMIDKSLIRFISKLNNENT